MPVCSYVCHVRMPCTHACACARMYDGGVGEGSVVEGEPRVMLYHKRRVDEGEGEPKLLVTRQLPHPPPVRGVKGRGVARVLTQRKRDAHAAGKVEPQRLRRLDPRAPTVGRPVGGGHPHGERPGEAKEGPRRKGVGPGGGVHPVERAARRALEALARAVRGQRPLSPRIVLVVGALAGQQPFGARRRGGARVAQHVAAVLEFPAQPERPGVLAQPSGEFSGRLLAQRVVVGFP